MIPTPPTANVLNPLLWLGCHVNGDLASTGSGVIINVVVLPNTWLSPCTSLRNTDQILAFGPMVNGYRLNGKW